MKQRKYTLGLDFGTESIRCLAVDIFSGEEKAVAVSNYSDGAITQANPQLVKRICHPRLVDRINGAWIA